MAYLCFNKCSVGTLTNVRKMSYHYYWKRLLRHRVQQSSGKKYHPPTIQVVSQIFRTHLTNSALTNLRIRNNRHRILLKEQRWSPTEQRLPIPSSGIHVLTGTCGGSDLFPKAREDETVTYRLCGHSTTSQFFSQD
ncbi:hypothetical protein J6590_006992 [Homalodisca vitripennis]|nr:hypothetical protein J6590_006992 [Homalodisca vitripennis]